MGSRKVGLRDIQLCAGLEASIDGATHATAQRLREQHMTEPGCEVDGVRRSVGQDCSGNKRDGEGRGGSEIWRDRGSFSTTRGVENSERRGERGGQG